MQTQETNSLCGVSDAAVRDELAQILQSPHFRLSKRSRQFLEHIVDQTLLGRGDELKERLIGSAVFGRSPDYSTGEDPVVRVQAGDVRRRLELYQANLSNPGPIRIELPSGTYIPTFRLREVSPSVEGVRNHPATAKSLFVESGRESSMPSAEPANDVPGEILLSQIHAQESPNVATTEPFEATRLAENQAEVSSRFKLRSSRRIERRLILMVVIVGALLSTIAFSVHPFARDPLNSFWEPVLKTSKPALICLSKPVVYGPSNKLVERLKKSYPEIDDKSPNIKESGLPISPSEPLVWGELVQRENTGPSIGSVIALAGIGRFFSAHGKSFDLRFGREASFSELRETSGVIIGGLDTPWTMRLTSGLPFELINTFGRQIHETNGPGVWQADYGMNGEKLHDFGLITREINSPTGQPIVQFAGITDRGTQAAVELVTNKSEFALVIKTLPNGWERKNLQIVVGTDVHEGKPGPPRVVACKVW